jgi:hypothetical protein
MLQSRSRYALFNKQFFRGIKNAVTRGSGLFFGSAGHRRLSPFFWGSKH